jgi:hypothetical protein
MEKEKVNPKLGERVLYHVEGKPDISEGIVEEISPSKMCFRIGGKWYLESSGKSDLGGRGPVSAQILDVLPAGGSQGL